VQRPADTIHAPVDVDEETLGSELLDRSLHDLADLDFGDLHELLLEDRRLEGELEETVERGVADDSGFVGGADLVGSGVGGECGGVFIGNVRDLQGKRDRRLLSFTSGRVMKGLGGAKDATYMNVSLNSIVNVNDQPPFALDPDYGDLFEHCPNLPKLLHRLHTTALRRPLLLHANHMLQQTQPKPLRLIRR
jgi:hypothetical protein